MPFIHALDPIIFQIGPFALRYYSLAYIIPLLVLYPWLLFCAKRGLINISKRAIDNFILFIGLGVILGGRLGYALFYSPSILISLDLFKVWQGGMSFHGGLLGVLVATIMFCKIYKVPMLRLADILVLPGTFGLFLGRIANFINGELWGTTTSVPWCVVFPRVDELCRHPSQLYEAAKNLLLFGITTITFFKFKTKDGTILSIFLIGYGLLRFTVNFVRDDPALIGPISMGQLLSLVTAAVGGALFIYLQKTDGNETKKQSKNKVTN